MYVVKYREIFQGFFVVKKTKAKLCGFFFYFHLWNKVNYGEVKVVNNEKCCSIFTVTAFVGRLASQHRHEILATKAFPVKFSCVNSIGKC